MIDQIVGNYRIMRQLGQGGMGVVYEAVHSQIGKRAAIKMLHPEFTHRPEFASRFFNEASATTMVQHPGLVNVYEYGHTQDKRPYLVMEFLEGEALRARLKRLGGRMGPSTLRVARQIASALAAAHEKGITHRDLKPDNVMLTPDPEAPDGERAKILDFGIAKLASDYAGPRAEMGTTTGATMGTAVYMAPEQCKNAAAVDPKSDVYALGIMLYEMLSGQPPFHGGGPGLIMGMHIYEEPAPLREREPSVSPELAELVHVMLAKDPAQRPTMRQIITALEQLGAPLSTGASVVPPELRLALRAPLSRQNSTLGLGASETQAGAAKRTKTIALGVAAAGVVALMGGLLWVRQPETRPVVVNARREVHWSVQSEPPGAEVLRAADGVILGRTPLEQRRLAAEGRIKVLLRHPGYSPRELELPLDSNATVHEMLSALPRAAQVTPPPEGKGPPKPHAPQKKGHGGGGTQKKVETGPDQGPKEPADWGDR